MKSFATFPALMSSGKVILHQQSRHRRSLRLVEEKLRKRERRGEYRISIPRWITGVESETTECAGTGQRGWIQ
ncbi:hypothetical protein OYC64_012078 [Pagothenia borchgrevinki]|uniref:Uncharacterized protein n=1 Tax=Pagothenia borchgrevinki TaxID=8213 RepID=A0ABD2G860_PAGBO